MPSQAQTIQNDSQAWRPYRNQTENSKLHMQHNKKNKAFRGYANVNQDPQFNMDNQMLVVNAHGPSAEVNSQTNIDSKMNEEMFQSQSDMTNNQLLPNNANEESVQMLKVKESDYKMMDHSDLAQVHVNKLLPTQLQASKPKLVQNVLTQSQQSFYNDKGSQRRKP
mmetsp:Transcript_5681/g.9759  ORF Transcript_5681/g.9759 Transcript_5681/m.9759 type:complete len:166 (-) Transcript_5681:128-625(-)